MVVLVLGGQEQVNNSRSLVIDSRKCLFVLLTCFALHACSHYLFSAKKNGAEHSKLSSGNRDADMRFIIWLAKNARFFSAPRSMVLT